jgi:hypothetical protein
MAYARVACSPVTATTDSQLMRRWIWTAPTATRVRSIRIVGSAIDALRALASTAHVCADRPGRPDCCGVYGFRSTTAATPNSTSRNRTHTPPNGITINVAVIVAANCKSENRGKKLSAIATTINRPEVTTDHAQPMTHHRIKRSITGVAYHAPTWMLKRVCALVACSTPS